MKYGIRGKILLFALHLAGSDCGCRAQQRDPSSRDAGGVTGSRGLIKEPPSLGSCKETDHCHVLGCSMPVAGSQRGRIHRAGEGDWEGFLKGFVHLLLLLGLSSFGSNNPEMLRFG